MISRELFKQMLSEAIAIEERDDKFEQALKDYSGMGPEVRYWTERAVTIVNWLRELTGDTDDVISWWMWDCPNQGKCKDDGECSIWPNHREEEVIVIRTIDDLYDYLESRQPATDKLQVAFKSQTEGVKFALNQIDKIQRKNNEVKNDGWEDRDGILNYIKDKIYNEYILETGADIEQKFPIEQLTLLFKVEDGGDNEKK